MDAVITAGGIPQPQDPLYSYSQGESKAMIDIAGKPMIQWVLDALGAARTIDRVVVIGLTDKSPLSCKKPLYFAPNQGRLLENLKAGTAKVMELNPKAKYVLFATSDIPGITGPMVDWVVNTCLQTKHDLYYNVIQRESMEERFPTSRRTFTRLKDLEICGGDMNVARCAIVGENSEFWDKVFEARKNPAAQAALIGPGIVFKLLFRQLTVAEVIERVAEKLGIRGRAIVCPYAEIGMDVDKPHQLEIMRAHLGRISRRAAIASRKPGGVRVGRAAPTRSSKPASRKATPKGARQASRKQTRTAAHKSKKSVR